jgi:6-phosphogluconolactonase (cycloisomerase 2 family)
VSRDGRHVYAILGDHDPQVHVLSATTDGKSLKAVSVEPVGGKGGGGGGDEALGIESPQIALLGQTESLLIATDQTSEQLVVFRRDVSTGSLKRLSELILEPPFAFVSHIRP